MYLPFKSYPCVIYTKLKYDNIRMNVYPNLHIIFIHSNLNIILMCSQLRLKIGEELDL
jgi:hypothetical protein